MFTPRELTRRKHYHEGKKQHYRSGAYLFSQEVGCVLPQFVTTGDAASHWRSSVVTDDVKEVIEKTPSELLSDVLERGVTVFGGGALLRGLPQVLEKMLGVPVVVAPEPLTTVVRGAGMITENPMSPCSPPTNSWECSLCSRSSKETMWPRGRSSGMGSSAGMPES